MRNRHLRLHARRLEAPFGQHDVALFLHRRQTTPNGATSMPLNGATGST